MYFTSCLSKRFISIHILIVATIQFMFICNVLSWNVTNTYLNHKCLVKQGLYKPGSAYQKKLNDLINDLSAIDPRDGFRHISQGTRPSSATVLYQCRGDSYLSKCRLRFNAAIAGLRMRCPGNKGGTIWLDQCFVEITSIDVMDAKIEIDYENNFSLHNPKKVSGDVKYFNKATVALLEKLTLKANDKNNKDDGKIALYASGEKKIGTKKVYAMVQCTRFIYMSKLCKVCLETIIKEYFPKCCDGRQGGRVLGTSCNFRYELYPFLRNNKTA